MFQAFQDFFKHSFFENSIISYCLFFGIILFGLLFKRILSKRISHLLFRAFRKYSTGIGADSFSLLLLKPIEIFLSLVILYIAFYQLQFPSNWHLGPGNVFGIRMILLKTFEIAIVFSLTWMVLRIIDFFSLILIYKSTQSNPGTKHDSQLIPFVKEAAKIMVFIFCIFFILGAVFNLNIASLIAGLGIGGLAKSSGLIYNFPGQTLCGRRYREGR